MLHLRLILTTEILRESAQEKTAVSQNSGKFAKVQLHYRFFVTVHTIEKPSPQRGEGRRERSERGVRGLISSPALSQKGEEILPHP